jgi:ABC-2 type transport system permease protein
MTLFITVALFGVGDAIGSEQREGTLESLLCTPTSVTTMVISALIIPLVLATVQGGLVLGIGIGVFGAGVDPGGVAVAVPIVILSIAAFMPLGVLAAAFLIVTKRGDPITALVSQVSAFLGGAAFPVAMLPGWLQVISHSIPQYYALHGLRAALLGGGNYGPVFGDSLVLGAYAVLLLGPSLWVYRRALHVARATGTLATY